ncbi:hypothetical protein F4X10_15265 [Candidatus Poribacteria bacterium]|nr:hypothetical protein [Candidatus Poribacteria bacterium]
MKKITVFLLTTCLVLTHFLTIGYTQETNLEHLRASDVNIDGVVNILDLTLVAAHLGTTPTADQTLNPDVNGDGTVNILDLVLAASHLGKRSGIPFEVTDATFDDIVLGSELPIVVEFKDDT